MEDKIYRIIEDEDGTVIADVIDGVTCIEQLPFTPATSGFLFSYTLIGDIMLFIKSFLIGIGKIIPGVSGAILAINFNVYERLLDSLEKERIECKYYKNYVSNLCILAELEKVLRDFDITGKIVQVNIGPTVTQYELEIKEEN